MYLWHRWCAVAGVVLIFPHYVLVTSVPPTIRNTFGNALGILALFGLVFLLVWALVPRLPVVGPRIRTDYQRWFTLHRFTGLFVITGLVHGFLVDPVLGHARVILGWYIAVAAVGTAAYLYQELLHRFFTRLWQHTYAVAAVNEANHVVEVTLAPVGRAVPFVAGQFVFVRFGGGLGWERHPFTISSAPQEPLLRMLDRGRSGRTRRVLAATSERECRLGWGLPLACSTTDVAAASKSGWLEALGSLHFGVGYTRSHIAARRVRDRPVLHGTKRGRCPVSRRVGQGHCTKPEVPHPRHVLKERGSVDAGTDREDLRRAAVGKGDLHVRADQHDSRLPARTPRQRVPPHASTSSASASARCPPRGAMTESDHNDARSNVRGCRRDSSGFHAHLH